MTSFCLCSPASAGLTGDFVDAVLRAHNARSVFLWAQCFGRLIKAFAFGATIISFRIITVVYKNRYAIS